MHILHIFFPPSGLTFGLGVAKIDSVWCTLPQFVLWVHCVSLITGVLPGFAFIAFIAGTSKGLFLGLPGILLDQELGIARCLFMLN